ILPLRRVPPSIGPLETELVNVSVTLGPPLSAAVTVKVPGTLQARIIRSAPQFPQEQPCPAQISGIESFGEPMEDVRQQGAAFRRPSTPGPQLAQARGRAKLQRLRPLPSRDLDGPEETRLGLGLLRASPSPAWAPSRAGLGLKREGSLQPIELGVPVVLSCPL